MAGSKFGRNYRDWKPVAPVVVTEEPLEMLAHAVGAMSAPARALRALRLRQAQGEDVVCLVDEGHFFVILRSELPEGLRPSHMEEG